MLEQRPKWRTDKAPIQLSLTPNTYGFKNQSSFQRLAFCALSIKEDDSPNWFHVTAHISDRYVHRHLANHLGDSLDHVCSAYRKKLFQAFHREQLSFSAFTVAHVAPFSEPGALSVNPVHGLHLHLAIRVNLDDSFRLHAVLQRLCHATHREAELFSAAKRFRPSLLEMQQANRGAAIFFKQCVVERGGLHGLIAYFEEKARPYRKNAFARGLSQSLAGQGIVHCTQDLRLAGAALFQREHKALRQALKLAIKKPSATRLSKASNKPIPVAAFTPKYNISSKAPPSPVEAHTDEAYVRLREELIALLGDPTARQTPIAPSLLISKTNSRHDE